MRTKVKVPSSEVALTRILEALGQELIDASDDEIRDAAKALGMDLMKGSAAFAGLTYPSKWQLSDFFELQACRKLQGEAERGTHPARKESQGKAQLSRPSEIPTEGKDPVDK
jgi:hypothetical protein